jgi:diguanylate cyclase (GGDEF)-like protein
MPSDREDYSERTVEVTTRGDLDTPLRVGRDHACVVVISGPQLGRRVVLAQVPVVLGRGMGCEVVLDSDSVSRRHARIEWTGNEHCFVDLGSTNGSYINEQRVTEQPLRDGDRLQVGKVLLKYIAGGNIENSYHQEIQRLASFDGLTGVSNRRHFDQMLAAEILTAQTKSRPLSLILMDVDHFKAINDKYGHTGGDAILRQVADCISGLIQDPQQVGRVGGEEFAVLWPGAGLSSAAELAEGFRAGVEAASLLFESVQIPVTISLGVADRAPASTDNAQALYQVADDRLYAAKAAGRNCVRSG